MTRRKKQTRTQRVMAVVAVAARRAAVFVPQVKQAVASVRSVTHIEHVWVKPEYVALAWYVSTTSHTSGLEVVGVYVGLSVIEAIVPAVASRLGHLGGVTVHQNLKDQS